ncbi:MAG: hypothetical protein LUG62_08400 [Clostridiales bacterium]|nr:hypothetical protein [Clostridiales bacterium]
MITKEMIAEGRANGTIKLVKDPNLEKGTVCQIGDYWFYFGGSKDLDYDPDEYVFHISEEDIQKNILSALEDFREDRLTFGDEYDYYESYLREQADNQTQVFIVVDYIPNVLKNIFSPLQLEDMMLHPESRLNPDVNQKIRDAAIAATEKGILDLCRKHKDKLYHPVGNNTWFCGWAGRCPGFISLETVRSDTLWTIQKDAVGEHIQYFASPDKSQYLRALQN